MNSRLRYPTDLSDAQWSVLGPLIPAPKPGGRPAKYPRREIVNALLYVLRTGCAWRLLPHDFPAWRSVYDCFSKWRRDGTLEAIHARLFVCARLTSGRNAQPSAGSLDSQSVKTTEKGGRAATTRARRFGDASGTCW